MVKHDVVSTDGDTTCLKSDTFIVHVKNDYKYFIGGDLFSFTWHKIGGHACKDIDDELYWYVDDEQYYITSEYCEACGFDGETTMLWVLKYGEYLPKHEEEL